MSKRVQQQRQRRRRKAARAARRLARRPALAKTAPGRAGGADRGAPDAAGERARQLAVAFARARDAPDAASRVLTLASQVLRLADREIAAVRQAIPPLRALACQPGCAWCCFLQVPVSAPEVLLLVDHLRRTRPAAELEVLRAQVAAVDTQTRGLPPAARLAARVPCPLLAAGRCSVYDVRPLACRGWNSYDARVCRHAVECAAGPTALRYEPQTAVTDALLAGLLAGLAAAPAALPPAEACDGRLELIAALRIALDTPNAAERWVAGDPIFVPAALPEDAPAGSPSGST